MITHGNPGGRDFATVAHEMRSPMTSVIGYLEILGEGSSGPLNAEQLAIVDVISRNADRAHELLDEIVAMASEQ